MKLDELLKEMWESMEDKDLPDEYLESHGHRARCIGEHMHGISMVPCEWVYPYLYALSRMPGLEALVEDCERDPESFLGDPTERGE